MIKNIALIGFFGIISTCLLQAQNRICYANATGWGDAVVVAFFQEGYSYTVSYRKRLSRGQITQTIFSQSVTIGTNTITWGSGGVNFVWQACPTNNFMDEADGD